MVTDFLHCLAALTTNYDVAQSRNSPTLRADCMANCKETRLCRLELSMETMSWSQIEVQLALCHQFEHSVSPETTLC